MAYRKFIVIFVSSTYILDMRVAVVGAGVIGVTSALAVKTAFPQFEVRVYGEKFSPDTTGDGSAGLWSPYLLRETPYEKLLQWCGTTHRWLEKLWKAGLASEIGLSLLPLYRFTKDANYPEYKWKEVVYGAQKLKQNEVKKLNADYEYGWAMLTYTVESVRLIPWLMREFEKAGGKLVKRKINALHELIDEGYDLIINCSGLGARELIGDDTVIPCRGQVARVSASWVMHSYMDDENYIIPNTESVVLGGTKQENDFDCNPRKEDSKFILDGCYHLLPSLKNGELLKEWVGLRPSRPEIRLEAEAYKSPKGKEVTVIHNYGHGGSGVTLSWGCALDVVSIIENRKLLKSRL